MTSPDILFIDDDADLRRANSQTLALAGWEVRALASAAEALACVEAGFDGVVVSDVRMPGMDGLELFRRLHAHDPDLPVILITGHGDIAMAVDAMREGAYDFIAKPFPPERLVATLRHALDRRRLAVENRRLRQAVEAAEASQPMLGDTPVMQRLRHTLRQLAQTDVDVLIEGETGSGKEVAAQLLHQWSHRHARPLVAINCGALPESIAESELFGHEAGAFTGALRRRVGRIEHAQGGTLFLDEIESMPAPLQVRLLRVLETREVSPLGSNDVRPVDIRVVAASKVDLGDPAQRGDFREDLFHRLNVVTVRLPPLRERRDDVRLLFGVFLNQAAQRFKVAVPTLGADVLRHLERHAWPGNVRELRHFAERVALGVADLSSGAPGGNVPPDDAPALSLPQRVERYEAEQIREALAACRGDVRATLQTLGIPRKTFYDKLQRHGIDRGAYEE